MTSPGSPVGPPACEGYQAVATDGSYLHVARVHCPGCADAAALREQLDRARVEFERIAELSRVSGWGVMAMIASRAAARAAPTEPDGASETKETT